MYHITQSLISSWNYLHSCRDECQDEAFNEFLGTLNRIRKEPTPEMQNGIEFENDVYKVASGDNEITHPEWEKGIKAVARIIKSAPVQVVAQRKLTLCSMDFEVYGILDSLKAGTIYDVKFSNKSFGSANLAGKYLESPQHPTYLFLVPEAIDFKYLVSDGVDLYTERYTRATSQPFECVLKEFIKSLDAMNLLDLYKAKWGMK